MLTATTLPPMSEEVRTEPALARTAGTPRSPRASACTTACAASRSCWWSSPTAGWSWPIDWIDDHAWVRPLFRNGNSGVTMFLVAGGLPDDARADGPARFDRDASRHRAGTPDRAGRPEPVAVPGRGRARRGGRRLDRHLARRRRRLGPARRDLHLELVRPGQPAALGARLRAPLVPVGRHAGLPVHGRGALPAAAPTRGAAVDPRWPLPAVHLVELPHGGRTRAPDPGAAPDHGSDRARSSLGVLAASALPLLARVRWQPRVSSMLSSLALLALVPLLFACDRDAAYLTCGRDGPGVDGRGLLHRHRARRHVAPAGQPPSATGPWSGSAATPC